MTNEDPSLINLGEGGNSGSPDPNLSNNNAGAASDRDGGDHARGAHARDDLVQIFGKCAVREVAVRVDESHG